MSFLCEHTMYAQNRLTATDSIKNAVRFENGHKIVLECTPIIVFLASNSLNCIHFLLSERPTPCSCTPCPPLCTHADHTRLQGMSPKTTARPQNSHHAPPNAESVSNSSYSFLSISHAMDGAVYAGLRTAYDGRVALCRLRTAYARHTCVGLRHDTRKKKRPKKVALDGAKRDRTVDLLTASQALSQLSYSPVPIMFNGAKRDRTVDLLTASQALSQLSYSPITDGIFPSNDTPLSEPQTSSERQPLYTESVFHASFF